jgi:hypothetical protein
MPIATGPFGNAITSRVSDAAVSHRYGRINALSSIADSSYINQLTVRGAVVWQGGAGLSSRRASCPALTSAPTRRTRSSCTTTPVALRAAETALAWLAP